MSTSDQNPSFPQQFRLGLGQDSHRFLASANNQAGCPLILGGLTIPDLDYSFDANSDGDVILHALCNAISTALSGGSLSSVADPLCAQGIYNSSAYLQPFLEQIKNAGYQIANVSISLEVHKPRLEPYRQTITTNLAQLLAISSHQIGLSFTSGEGLTAFGRGEGIAAQALILLEKSPSLT